jgi:DNA-binding CsgD family transcriptional regulator
MRLRMLEDRDIRQGLATWPLPDVEPLVATAVMGKAHAADRLMGAVVEHPTHGTLLAIGISGFVRGTHIHAASEAGQPLVAGLIASEAAGMPAFLATNQIASAAREDDLHVVVLLYRQYSFDPQDPQVREVLSAGHAAFRLVHGGYRMRAVWQEGDASDESWMRPGGLLLKRAYPSTSGPGRILCAALREDAGSDWPGHTVSFLFNSQTPRLHLTPMQQRVAQLALWNLGDEQVARRLAISPATVRQHWRGIFDRVQDRCPEVLGEPALIDAPAGRGPEKRGQVLEFLRGNLHEVRATS